MTSRRPWIRASACHLVVAAAAAAAVLSTGPSAHAAAGTVSAASAPASCMGYRYNDTKGDAVIDGVVYGLDYSCATDRWQGWVQTSALLAPGQLGAFELDFDTDLDIHTGCNGADWALYATYDAGTGGVKGSARHYPSSSCSSYTNVSAPVQAYADQARGSKTVEVSAVAGPLTYDRNVGFRWWSRISSTGGSVDRMPNGSAMRTYVPTGSSAFLDRTPPNLNNTYKLAGGDFNGDGYGDILLYGPGSRPDYILEANPGSMSFDTVPISIPGMYDRIITGDFNGDGRTDMLLYRAGVGPDALWFAKPGGGFTTQALSINSLYTQIVAGDFNGDGVDDILFYAAGAANDWIWWFNSGGTHTTSHPVIGATYTSLATGDFDGDGRTDILFYRAGTGTDYIWRGQPSGAFVGSTVKIDGTYDKLVVGDFDTDGRDDVLFYARGTAPDRIMKGSQNSAYLVSGPAANINESYTDVVSGRFDGNTTSDLYFYQAGAAPERWWVSSL